MAKSNHYCTSSKSSTVNLKNHSPSSLETLQGQSQQDKSYFYIFWNNLSLATKCFSACFVCFFSPPPLFLNNISQLVFLQVYAEQVPCKPRKLKLWERCELMRYPEGQPAEPPASELWAVLLGLTRACIKAEDQESQYLLRFKQNLEAQRGDTLERKHSSPITTEKFPIEKLWDK